MDLAAIAWKQGQFDGAVGRYREVLSLDPNHELAALNLGNLHYDVLWREDADVRREESWAMAQRAYLYYLGLTENRSLDRFDLFDTNFAVPHRLREIEELIGAYDGPPVRVADF